MDETSRFTYGRFSAPYCPFGYWFDHMEEYDTVKVCVAGRDALKMTHDGRTVYQGGYLHGKYHGYGTLYDDNSAKIYQGWFKEGKYHGSGKYFVKGALAYQGKFQEGNFYF